MMNYEMLLRTKDAARKARYDGLEKFSEALDEIADSLLKQLESVELAPATAGRNCTRLEWTTDC